MECPERVTVRVLPEKRQIYPRFRDYVTKELGSDICYVTTSLWEIFLRGMDQLPPTKEPFEIKFLRQNVQINMGCTMNYNVKKARRTPGALGLPTLEIGKNHFFPLLLEEWPTLSEAQKLFWRQRLQEAGIISKPIEKRFESLPSETFESPPSVSTGIIESTSFQARQEMENSMTNVSLRVSDRVSEWEREGRRRAAGF